jgi:hypothetical protein
MSKYANLRNNSAKTSSSKYSNNKVERLTADQLCKKYEDKTLKLVLDVENEKQTPQMKGKVRYFNLAISENGKVKKLILETVPTRTTSSIKARVDDEQKDVVQNKMSFNTRIPVTVTVNNKNEFTIDDSNETLTKLACQTVDGLELELTDAEYDEKVDNYIQRLTSESKLWKAYMILETEFKKLMADEAYLDSIGLELTKKHSVRGCVQRFRKPNPDNPDEAKMKKSDEVPLDEPIIYNIIKFDNKQISPTFGTPYATILNSDGKIATWYDNRTKKQRPVDYFNIAKFMTIGSLYTGEAEFQVCFCKDGVYLHNVVKKAVVRRAEPQRIARNAIPNEKLSLMNSYDGKFSNEAGDDEELDSQDDESDYESEISDEDSDDEPPVRPTKVVKPAKTEDMKKSKETTKETTKEVKEHAKESKEKKEKKDKKKKKYDSDVSDYSDEDSDADKKESLRRSLRKMRAE